MNRGTIECGVQQTKTSEMSRALSEMDQAVSRLEEIIKAVSMKFGPVLVNRPQCDPRPCDKPPSQPCSELVSIIRLHAERIEAFGVDLVGIADRCDL